MTKRRRRPKAKAEEDHQKYDWWRKDDPVAAQRALYKEAVSQLLDQISGNIGGERAHVRREEPWASVRHCLADLLVWQRDGVSPGSSSNFERHERYIDKKRTFKMPQMTKIVQPPAYMRRVELIDTARRALHFAYAELPDTNGLMDEKACRFALMCRLVGEQTTVNTAAYVACWVHYATVPRDVLVVDEKGHQRVVGPVTTKLIGRVVRWGEDRMYTYLRERGVVPERKREQRPMANKATGADLEGWTQIADFLDCSENHARKLAKEHGLPIKRLHGRVHATKEAIRVWAEAAQEPYADDAVRSSEVA